MRRVLLTLLSLLVCAVAAAPATAAATGETESGSVTFRGSEYPYLLHTPGARHKRAVPLVVVVHGCQTTARQEMELTRFNELADREGFAVLYPEVDALERQQPGPVANCWRFFEPSTYFRGNGDPAAIAEMTRSVMASRRIDPERVYSVGVSAGGLMTAVGAAAYSDLYAAVGVVVSAGYADGTCFGNGVGTPVEASAQLAFAQMGPRERVVPIVGIGSDADAAFPAPCTVKAVEQGLRTSNLVLSGTQTAPLSLAPAAVREERPAGRLAYTVSDFRDPAGCLVAQRWIVHGMPHAWPGGAAYGGYTDLRAPDGAEATWTFLERYRRSGTAMPCATSGPSSS